MTERLPWFPCEQTKLLAALAQMQPSEGYVYCVMLLRIYECGGACPDDIDAIATRTRFNKRVTSEALNRLFKAGRLRRDADGIHNPVADRVIASAQSLREKRKEAGKDGAERRWKKTDKNQQKTDGKPMPEPMANDSYLHLQRQENRKVKEESAALTGGLVGPPHGWPSDAWVQFYVKYPHKIGKADAFKAFNNVRRKGAVKFEDMMAGLDSYVNKTDDRPWCNPATWLNQGRWEDKPAANRGGSDGRTGTDSGSGGGAGEGFSAFAARRAREASEA